MSGNAIASGQLANVGVPHGSGSHSEAWYLRETIKSQLETTPEGYDPEEWKKAKADILGMRSEEDTIRLHVLAKLAKIKESTCEWDSVVALCDGETNRIKQAQIIAASIWEKELAARKLAVFAPNKSVLHDMYTKNDVTAREIREKSGDDFKVQSLVSKNADAIYKFLVGQGAKP